MVSCNEYSVSLCLRESPHLESGRRFCPGQNAYLHLRWIDRDRRTATQQQRAFTAQKRLCSSRRLTTEGRYGLTFRQAVSAAPACLGSWGADVSGSMQGGLLMAKEIDLTDIDPPAAHYYSYDGTHGGWRELRETNRRSARQGETTSQTSDSTVRRPSSDEQIGRMIDIINRGLGEDAGRHHAFEPQNWVPAVSEGMVPPRVIVTGGNDQMGSKVTPDEPWREKIGRLAK